MSNIQTRIISALVIVSLFLTAIFLFRSLFFILICLIAVAMLYEWYQMTKSSTFHILLGLLIIPMPIISLLLLGSYDSGGWLIFTYFVIIWTVDIMAMFGGKLIGGAKLAPKLSPNKTISGLAVGVLSAIIIVNLLALLSIYDMPFPMKPWDVTLIIMTAILAIFAQLSDLFISYFKRKFEIKDSGTIIPGHGGMLDRFDSIIFTAPMVILYLMSYNAHI